MLNIVLILVIALLPIFVYFDATKHKIGKIPGKSGFTNNSAGNWAVGTLLLAIVIFPLYLIKRKSLILLANESPVEANSRNAKLAVIAIISSAWSFMLISVETLSQLPSCDRADSISLVAQIVGDMPLVQAAGTSFVSLKNIVEQGYNEQTELRSCSATLVTTAGEDTIQYSIRWQNKDAAEFYIEARIQ